MGSTSQTRSGRRHRVPVVGGMVLLVLLLSSGCSTGEFTRLGMPVPSSDRADHILGLWQGAWIAALAVGAVVWGLIIWAIFAYRKRSEAAPVQTRYHMPIETLFTVVPFIMIAVLFYFTVNDQNAILKQDEDKSPPKQIVNAVGQQWSWTFNYKGPDKKDTSDDVWESGTPRHLPDLYLPVGEKVRFELTSPDTLHSFFIPAFLFKMDVFPGKTNTFELTPTKEGTFAGKCAELCGSYHSRMLFNVHVVSAEEYQAHLKKLKAEGQTGSATGGADTTKIAGQGSESEAALNGDGTK